MFRCYVASTFLVTGFWSTLMHESCHINKKKKHSKGVWGTFHLFNHNSSFYTCIKNSVLNQVTWQNENTAIPYLALTPAAPPPLYVLSHVLSLSPDPSMQHPEMSNVAGQHGISHTSGPHGHQRSGSRQILLSVCHAPLGLLCPSKGLRTWEKRGRRSDGVCGCVCVSSYMGDWQESLKSCQQLNL